MAIYTKHERGSMSRQGKISLISIVVTIVLSTLTIAFTIGAVPYKAGALVERVEVCESKFEKLDKVADDVSYIRGWIDSQKEK